MKVKNLKTTFVNGRKRVSAEILWEDATRPLEEIYFEVDERFADDLTCSAEGFVLATIFPALYYGETRYSIEEEISPVFYQGLKDVLGWYYHWFYQNRKPIQLEIKTKSKADRRKEQGNSACFFSGGIDSLATLFDNRSIYPKEHPGYINDGVVAFGLEQDDPEKFEHFLTMLENLANKLNVNLIPVYTNVYLNYREEDSRNNWNFWTYEFQGAALSSIAHMLSNRLDFISIASTYDLSTQMPHGLHPLISPNFSSENLQIRHDGVLYSRLEKVKLVAEHYPYPIELRVCNRYKQFKEGDLNCGKCNKCIITMLEFLVLGELEKMETFPVNNVTADMIIKYAKIKDPNKAMFFSELIDPLKRIQRLDLAEAVEYKLQLYHNQNSKINTMLARINHKIFNDKLRKKLP